MAAISESSIQAAASSVHPNVTAHFRAEGQRPAANPSYSRNCQTSIILPPGQSGGISLGY
jgi:hypothetical protein